MTDTSGIGGRGAATESLKTGLRELGLLEDGEKGNNKIGSDLLDSSNPKIDSFSTTEAPQEFERRGVLI